MMISVMDIELAAWTRESTKEGPEEQPFDVYSTWVKNFRDKSIFVLQEEYKLTDVAEVTIVAPFEKFITGNDLYSAFYARKKGYAYVTKQKKAREFQQLVMEQCESLVSEDKIFEDTQALAMHYLYMIPKNKFRTKKRKIWKYDLTNLVKIVEDGIFKALPKPLDDAMVVRKTEDKIPSNNLDEITILVRIEFFKE